MKQLAHEATLPGRSGNTLLWRRAARAYRPHLIAAETTGYIQTTDYAGLVSWCVDHSCMLEARAKAGDFIVAPVCLFKVYGCEPEELDDAVSTLHRLIVTGPVRTPVQDPEYPITQLNIGCRRATFGLG